MIFAEITTIDVVNSIVGGLALLLAGGQIVVSTWRFRHPLYVEVESEWARNPDGTKRDFDHWRVQLLNRRERPITVHEIWWQLEDDSSWQAKPVDLAGHFERDRLPMTLSDHAPVALLFDLDTFSEPGHPSRPRAAVAVDTEGHEYVGWVKWRPWWKPRRRPRRKVMIKTGVFLAPPDNPTVERPEERPEP